MLPVTHITCNTKETSKNKHSPFEVVIGRRDFLGCHLLRIYFSFDRGLPPAIEPAKSINSPFVCWVSAILRSCWPLKSSKLNHGPMTTWCYDVWTIQSYPSHNRWLAGLPKRVITQIPGQESIVFQQFLIQVKWNLQPDKLDQLVLAVSGWDPLTWDVFLILFKEEGVQMTTLSWPSNLFALLAVETRRMSVIEICFLEIWVYQKESKRTCYSCITLP